MLRTRPPPPKPWIAARRRLHVLCLEIQGIDPQAHAVAAADGFVYSPGEIARASVEAARCGLSLRGYYDPETVCKIARRNRENRYYRLRPRRGLLSRKPLYKPTLRQMIASAALVHLRAALIEAIALNLTLRTAATQRIVRTLDREIRRLEAQERGR